MKVVFLCMSKNILVVHVPFIFLTEVVENLWNILLVLNSVL